MSWHMPVLHWPILKIGKIELKYSFVKHFPLTGIIACWWVEHGAATTNRNFEENLLALGIVIDIVTVCCVR
jgi:hypothetical protein